MSSAVSVVRTCIGCRQKAANIELLRVVAVTSTQGFPEVMPDPLRRLPGRGAWLHRNPSCLATAVKRRAFGRALRVTGQLGVDMLTAYFASAEVSEQDMGPLRRG